MGPLSPEQTAAAKHRNAAKINAIVKADMNGFAMALGKNLVHAGRLVLLGIDLR